MYPFYYPSSSYSPYPSSSIDADYFRALAEERAAREQYVAARRAQEEARQRAARARAARRAYVSPYSSFHDENDDGVDIDMGLEDSAYYSRQRPLGFATSQPYGGPSVLPQYSPSPFGLNAPQHRAILEEQRRRELLELETERRRQEEDRLRRIIQEERQREEVERRRILEEERTRRALEEEKLRRAIEEEKLRRAILEEEAARRERERTPLRSQQASLEPLLRAFGFVPVGSDSESDKERPSRDARNGRNLRAHTTSPGPRQAGATPPSPIRVSKSDQPSTSPVSGFADTPASATTIPITSPKPSPKTDMRKSPMPDILTSDRPTLMQVAAAEKIQDAYRTYSARKTALKSISTLRKRFLSAKSSFALPATLDYEAPSAACSSISSPLDGRAHITVHVDPSAQLPSPSLHDTDPFQHVPKLAYTPANAPLHAYEEELSRILSALDAVESHGDTGIRAARRELARMVEREAERVERWRGVVWTWWIGREKASAPSVVTGPGVVPEPAIEDAPQNVHQGELMVAQPGHVALASDGLKDQEMTMQVEPPKTRLVVEEDPSKTSSTETQVEPIADIAVLHQATITSDDLGCEHIPVLDDAPAPAQQPSAIEQPFTPEIDIPDADVDSALPFIAPEPEGTSSSVSQRDRPSTPPLALDQSSESDTAMEVEPQEAHTPPPAQHTPLVVIDPPAVDESMSRDKQVGQEPMEGRPVPKSDPSPSADQHWKEDMLCV